MEACGSFKLRLGSFLITVQGLPEASEALCVVCKSEVLWLKIVSVHASREACLIRKRLRDTEGQAFWEV